MLREVFIHLEHSGLAFAKDLLEHLVGYDLTPIGRVLQIVFPDVLPDFTDHLTARKRLKPYYGGQVLGWL